MSAPARVLRERCRRGAVVAAARAFATLCAAVVAVVSFAGAANAADPAKTLRIAQFDIDTLDPQGYTDDPSFQVIQAIFEAAYEWDYLAKTPTLVPLTASAVPEITDEGRTWTIRLKRGILFHDDPAFKGKPRELTADDYVYAYKRWIDPNGRRGGQPILTDLIIGAREAVEDAKKRGRFDFDRPIEGLKVIDRYTYRLRMKGVNYPNVRDMVGFVGALPREVVEDAKGDIRARPVGTGAYKLKSWKRGSKIVLEAFAGYREAYFPESRDPADAELVRTMKGRRVPMAGTLEIDIIDEDITRLLAFEKGDLDFVQLRGEIATRLLDGDKLKPEYAARGITRFVHAEPFLFSLYFMTKDPIIGGMDTAHVALRRAIALGYDTDTMIRVVLAGQAIPAGQMIPPGVSGHDPSIRAKSLYDPATANALLDRTGFGKRDAAGFRLAPDGAPVVLTLSLRTGGVTRELQTLFKKNMEALGLRTEFRVAPFQEIIKDLEKSKYQMYQGGFGGAPTGYNIFSQLHSIQPQRINTAQFANADFDAAMERFLRAGDDAAILAAARTMNEIDRTFMPQLPLYFRLESSYVHKWLLGYRPMVFSSYWKYLDVDPALKK